MLNGNGQTQRRRRLSQMKFICKQDAHLTTQLSYAGYNGCTHTRSLAHSYNSQRMAQNTLTFGPLKNGDRTYRPISKFHTRHFVQVTYIRSECKYGATIRRSCKIKRNERILVSLIMQKRMRRNGIERDGGRVRENV